MKPFDQKKQARMAVSERLRLFFSHLKEQIAPGTEALWRRVETEFSTDHKQTEKKRPIGI